MYLDQKVCLYSPPGGNLQPYNYSFPFAMQLPLHIPSSFIGSVGKIHYRVKANVHRRGMHMATNVLLPFSVVGIKDLNVFPQLQNPVKMHNQKTFGALFWKSKPLTANLSINKQAFVSGESILVSGAINNESDVRIKECELKLIRHTDYYARGKKRSDKDTVYKCSQPAIEKETQANWTNVPVFVPCLPPSDLDGCHIIKTAYILLVRIVPPGMHFALELTFSITIGTIPFRQNAVPYPQVPGGAGYAPPMPGAGGTGYAPPMPGAGGAGYAPPMPGAGGTGYAPPMPGAGGTGYAPPMPGAGYAPPMPVAGGAGYAPPSNTGYQPPPYSTQPGGPAQSAEPSVAPSAPAMPYGDVQPTFGVYRGDSNELPSYDSLFKGSPDDEDKDHEGAKNYQPKYPSFKIPPKE